MCKDVCILFAGCGWFLSSPSHLWLKGWVVIIGSHCLARRWLFHRPVLNVIWMTLFQELLMASVLVYHILLLMGFPGNMQDCLLSRCSSGFTAMWGTWRGFSMGPGWDTGSWWLWAWRRGKNCHHWSLPIPFITSPISPALCGGVLLECRRQSMSKSLQFRSITVMPSQTFHNYGSLQEFAVARQNKENPDCKNPVS